MIYEKYKEDLKAEVDQLAGENRLTDAYKRRKLIIWSIRTILTIILYIIFWKHEWVRWTLVLYIPLTIFNLVMIFGFNYLVDRKVKRVNSKIDRINPL